MKFDVLIPELQPHVHISKLIFVTDDEASKGHDVICQFL